MTRMRPSTARRRCAAGAARTWPGRRSQRSAVIRSPISSPAPAPKVIEYVAQAKECAGCGAVTAGELPAHVRARASYGPETCAQAANLVSGHHIPVYRATLLLCQLAGVAVSTGWMAGIRGKAAALVEASGFMDRVRELLKTAPAVHADETPARAAGGTRYVHLACTRYLTCMHTGDRSAEAIDAGAGAARLRGRHRPRRLRRLRAPDQRPARLVRGSPAAGISRACTTSSQPSRNGRPRWRAC